MYWQPFRWYLKRSQFKAAENDKRKISVIAKAWSYEGISRAVWSYLCMINIQDKRGMSKPFREERALRLPCTCLGSCGCCPAECWRNFTWNDVHRWRFRYARPWISWSCNWSINGYTKHREIGRDNIPCPGIERKNRCPASSHFDTKRESDVLLFCWLIKKKNG